MKVRLIRGPFSGKVFDISPQEFGQNYIRITGYKKLSRKEKEQAWRDFYTTSQPNWMDPRAIPGGPLGERVSAEYRLVMVQNPNARINLYSAGTYTQSAVNALIPSVHPDGSLFYEFARTI